METYISFLIRVISNWAAPIHPWIFLSTENNGKEFLHCQLKPERWITQQCKYWKINQPWWKKWCKFRRPLQQGISKVQSMPNSSVNCNKKRSKQLTQLFILINLMDGFVSLQRKTSTMFHNKWASLFPRWVALKGGLRTGELSNFPVFGKCASFCGPFLISKILVKAVTRT